MKMKNTAREKVRGEREITNRFKSMRIYRTGYSRKR